MGNFLVDLLVAMLAASTVVKKVLWMVVTLDDKQVVWLV
jgi:hypothetical protein